MNTLSVFGMKWNEPSLRSDLTALMDTYAVQVKGDLTGIPNLIMIRAANPGPLSRWPFYVENTLVVYFELIDLWWQFQFRPNRRYRTRYVPLDARPLFSLGSPCQLPELAPAAEPKTGLILTKAVEFRPVGRRRKTSRKGKKS